MTELKPCPFCCGERTEMDKRLMPPGMEWPRFDDGMKITWGDAPEDIAAVCLALDGSCYSLHYDMPDDERMCIYEVSERVKRPVTVVLGADGLPIKVGETVWYVGEPIVRGTVEAVGEGEVMLAGDGVYAPLDLTHTQPDTQERIDDDATIKLRNCPFCGGEATGYEWSDDDEIDEGEPHLQDAYCAVAVDHKDDCLLKVGEFYMWIAETEEEAAEIWNTRVERTCHDDGREGGERMSEKKYLLTESDIRKIKDLECGWCADNAGGHFNCAEASKAEQKRLLEANEYRERTCQI